VVAFWRIINYKVCVSRAVLGVIWSMHTSIYTANTEAKCQSIRSQFYTVRWSEPLGIPFLRTQIPGGLANDGITLHTLVTRLEPLTMLQRTRRLHFPMQMSRRQRWCTSICEFKCWPAILLCKPSHFHPPVISDDISVCNSTVQQFELEFKFDKWSSNFREKKRTAHPWY